MNKKIIWPYYIWMYFDILNKANKNYRILIKLSGKNNHKKIEKKYYEIMEEITQIIPCGYEKNRIKLKPKDGILELANNVSFIKNDFKTILKKYNDELISIKVIRNNVEHSPHRVTLCAQVSGMGSSNITLNYYKKGSDLDNIKLDDLIYCHCSTLTLKNLISDLNELFKKIRKEIRKLSSKGKIDKELTTIYRKYKLKI